MSWCSRPTWWRLTTLFCPSRACRRDVKVALSLLPLLPRLAVCWSRQGTSVFFHRWLICWCCEMSMSVQLSCFIDGWFADAVRCRCPYSWAVLLCCFSAFHVSYMYFVLSDWALENQFTMVDWALENQLSVYIMNFVKKFVTALNE